MKGVQLDLPQPECHQFDAQIVIQDFEGKCRLNSLKMCHKILIILIHLSGTITDDF